LVKLAHYYCLSQKYQKVENRQQINTRNRNSHAQIVQSNNQFNDSKGTISNVMKLFIASGGVQHRFTINRHHISTPKQDKLLIWLSQKPSHSDHVELKTDLQTNNKVSASASIAKR
jgi:hypothetical protein